MTDIKPRFSRISKLAVKFMKEHKINDLPVEPFDLISQHSNWKAKTYYSWAQRHRISEKDVIDFADSIDGCAYYHAQKDRYFILYNNNPSYITEPRRITWTLIHEIGHVYLGHLKETGEAIISRNTLNEEKYKNLEAEANFFAASVLSPYIVLKALKIKDYKTIMKFCGLSKEAAQYRETGLKNWKNRKRMSREDLLVFLQFSDFIHQKGCSQCGFGFISNKAIYCPICGRKLEWGKGNMIYDGYELDENSKAIICPKCKNEEPEKGEYCSICGTYLINKCTDITHTGPYDQEYLDKEGCGSLAAGNARYCTYCGNPTTYYEAGLLVDWDKAIKKLEPNKISDVSNKEVAATIDNGIPF